MAIFMGMTPNTGSPGRLYPGAYQRGLRLHCIRKKDHHFQMTSVIGQNTLSDVSKQLRSKVNLDDLEMSHVESFPAGEVLYMNIYRSYVLHTKPINLQ